MVLESSVEEFVARFREYAAQGTLYPQMEGSPLLEFSAGGRVLYLFDRTGPYAAKPGPARVIVHGVVETLARLELPPEERREQLGSPGVSSVEGQGEVIEVARGFCVVQARLPLLLGSFAAWPDLRRGDWVTFQTLPPLHGFTV